MNNKPECFSKTKFYRTWYQIQQRCTNPKAPNYFKYGGKGTVCEWENIAGFKKDMYKSHLEHMEQHGAKDTTIERINSNGNYSKKNCCWATYAEQNKNRSDVRLVDIGGVIKPLIDWCRHYKINPNTVYSRITKYGWGVKDSILLPLQRGKKLLTNTKDE